MTRERKTVWIHERGVNLSPDNHLTRATSDTVRRIHVGAEQLDFIVSSILYDWPACDQTAIWSPRYNWLTVFADDLEVCYECGRITQSTPPEWKIFELDLNCLRHEIEAGVADKLRSYALSRLSVPEFTFSVCKADDCDELAHRAAKRVSSKLRRCRKNPHLLTEESHQWLQRHKKAPQRSYACYVYLLHCAGRFKIGHGLSVRSRIRGMQTGCPYPIELVQEWKSEDAPRVERFLHERFAEFRRTGEWFDLPPAVVASLKRIGNIDLERSI